LFFSTASEASSFAGAFTFMSHTNRLSPGRAVGPPAPLPLVKLASSAPAASRKVSVTGPTSAPSSQ